ncbi:hypothetical protein D3C87_1681270 [compost metagenome]
MGGIELTLGLAQARVDHALHGLQLGGRTKGANALNLVGLDGETLRQVHGVERDHLTLACTHDQTRGAALTRRHQGQGVAVLFDLHGQGTDPFLAKQAKAADAARQVFLLIDRRGQRRYGKNIVGKNANVGHEGTLQKSKTPLKAGLGYRGLT